MPNNKLSSYEPGQVVTDISGVHYRVASKVADSDGTVVRFADMQGRPVSEVVPVSPAFAQFASLIRFHLAYNKDFNLYILGYIDQFNQQHSKQQLPYPVGTDGKPYDWAGFLEKQVAQKLPENIDPSEKDELIHEMLFTYLGQRRVLEQFEGVRNKESFPHKEKELAQQLTQFLIDTFSWGKKMIRGWIIKRQPKEISMWQPGDEGEELNILDTKEHATQPKLYDGIPRDIHQSEHDIREFRDGFYGWLKKHQSETSAKWFITLFDIYWEWVSESTESPNEGTGRPGYTPARRHLEPLWKKRTRLSNASLYEYIGRLAKLLEQYIQENRRTLGEDDIFVKLIDNIHHEREKLRRRRPKVKASLASLNLAAEEQPEPASGRTVSAKIAKQLIHGTNLTPEMLRQVKDAFVHRWTSDNPRRTSIYHCDKCDINRPYVNTESSEGHDHPTIPLQTDADWLGDKAFYFTNAGRLLPGHFEPGILANPVLAPGARSLTGSEDDDAPEEPPEGKLKCETCGKIGDTKVCNGCRERYTKTAEFGENVLPPNEAAMCSACGYEEAVPGKEYCQYCLADVEHLVCPRCLECTQCNLRPCKNGGPHMEGVERSEAWRMNKEMARAGKLGAAQAEKAMTLNEAKKQQLDVTFLRDAEEAEGYAKSLTAAGREVVAIWNETLPGATEEHWMLACRPAKRAPGPPGLDTRKEGSEDADYESLHPNWKEEERETRETEFNGMRDYMDSLGWLGKNPWYPEKYPWWGMRIYSDGWSLWKRDLAANKEERVATGTTLNEMKKYLSRYDLEKLRTVPGEPKAPRTKPKDELDLTEEDKRFLREDMKIKAKKAAVSGLGNEELLEATANLLEARGDGMLTAQDWKILQDAFDYASGDEPIPSISIALANLLDTHRVQPPMVTSEQWEETAKAYEDITGNHIEWRKPDELSDEDWEKQYGEKEAGIGHDFYDGIRPQITPGDTGRLPHARKEGASTPDLEAQVRIEWSGMYDSRHLELDGWEGTWEWTDYGASNELNLGTQVGPCGSVEEAKQKLQDFVFGLGEPATYITYGDNEIVRKGDDPAKARKTGTDGDFESTLLDLLEQAAHSLQEGTSDTGEGMNNPLAMEIEDLLNAKGRSMYGPEVASRLPKTAARPEDFVAAFHRWLEKGKRMLEGFVTDDKYLARSVQEIHVHLQKIDGVLEEIRKAEPDPAKRDWKPGEWANRNRVGAGPVTPQQMLVKNVQQSQGVQPEAQQPQPAVPAQPSQPAVAITPQSGRGEDAPMRKTILPELANPNFHMSSDEPVDYEEPPAELTQLVNTKLRGHRAVVPMSSGELDPGDAPSDDLWFAMCGQCGAVWSFTNGDLMMKEVGDGSCQVGLPENTTMKTSARLKSSDEDGIFADKKGFFESVRTKYR